MTIHLSDIARSIEQALRYFKPAQKVNEFYGEYYSPYYGFMSLIAACFNQYAFLAVELGVDQGRGLVSLASGTTGNGVIIGIDHTFKDNVEIAQKLYSNIIFLEQDTMPVPDWFNQQNRKISLLHIDTEHSYAMADSEFHAYKPLLAKPAVVIFDDLHAQDDDVLKLFMELPYPKIQDDRLHPECGWGVILYE